MRKDSWPRPHGTECSELGTKAPSGAPNRADLDLEGVREKYLGCSQFVGELLDLLLLLDQQLLDGG